MITDYANKVYVVYDQYIAKHLINDCHFKLLNVRACKEDSSKVMFRFEDTQALRQAIADFKED